MTGQNVPQELKRSTAYRNAEFKSNQIKKFNAMTPSQLLDNIKQGQIGTEMDSILASNPNYIQAKQEYEKFQKVDNINKNMATITNAMK